LELDLGWGSAVLGFQESHSGMQYMEVTEGLQGKRGVKFRENIPESHD
jgi:hypothetical protein